MGLNDLVNFYNVFCFEPIHVLSFETAGLLQNVLLKCLGTLIEQQVFLTSQGITWRCCRNFKAIKRSVLQCENSFLIKRVSYTSSAHGTDFSSARSNPVSLKTSFLQPWAHENFGKQEYSYRKQNVSFWLQ